VIPIDSVGPTSCCAPSSGCKRISPEGILILQYTNPRLPLPRPTKSLCVCVWVIYSRKYYTTTLDDGFPSSANCSSRNRKEKQE
jgi:hypothetical protein